MQKPSLPRGTRDFGPAQMTRRNYIFDTIKSVFRTFGFLPLETPALENLSVLTGKYGDEGDQLIFKVLDSGEYYEKMIKKNAISTEVITEVSARVIDFFNDLFKDIFHKINNSLGDEETDLLSTASVIEKIVVELTSAEHFSQATYLENQKELLLKDFFKEYTRYITYELSDFFHKTHFYVGKETFIEDFGFYFEQFRNVSLSGEIIPKFSQFAQNKVLQAQNKALQEVVFKSSKEVTREISEKGLRYDLTVPFARYVVMSRNEITFPFKRYQIQPVWRADRPQKGRYREFYQCDADVVGTDSLLCEAEIVLMINEVMQKLNIPFTIKVNNRKILTGIAESVGAAGKESALCVAIDKLDKIGQEAVEKELLERGFSNESVEKLNPVFALSGDTTKKISQLQQLFIESASETGQQGLRELQTVLQYVSDFGLPETHLEFDTTLARGLSYYTGAIFEVKANGVQIGSISGGGRYDNLTGAFGLKGVSGVGISFGVDRIVDVMEELNLFLANHATTTQVLFSNFDAAAQQYSLPLLRQFREAGVACEIYPEAAKLKKQLDYANHKQIPFVLLIGSTEMASGNLTLKNMQTGEQTSVTLQEAIKIVASAKE